MDNRCPKCGEYSHYCDDNNIEQDGDTLWITYWCRCGSCSQHWKYIEEFTLKDAWVEETVEEN